MMVQDCRLWKKDDVGITRAPGPLSEQQAERAEKVLSAASDLLKGETKGKTAGRGGKSSRAEDKK
jgi:hypothetical protein